MGVPPPPLAGLCTLFVSANYFIVFRNFLLFFKASVRTDENDKPAFSKTLSVHTTDEVLEYADVIDRVQPNLVCVLPSQKCYLSFFQA